jgi:hypothetical protein
MEGPRPVDLEGGPVSVVECEAGEGRKAAPVVYDPDPCPVLYNMRRT